MKFKDPITGEYKTLHLKTGDTLPVGTIVSFEGDEIPEGYEEVIGEEARVVISPTEPTTGEEVWIQKGKNLFNPNNVNYNKWLSEAGELYTANEGDIVTSFIGVLPNINYTISGLIAAQWLVVCGYDINKNFVALLLPSTGSSGISWTFKVPSNVAYIRCGFSGFKSSETDIQIELGDTATPYEPFTRKIHIKNDNGVYEEFYDETNREMYSTGEQKIGTWIDGKPLYRKVITMGALPNAAAKYTPHGIQNLGTVVSLKGMAQSKETNSRIVLPCPDTTPQYTVQLFASPTNIVLNTAFDQSKFNESFAIIEYTKITD